MREDSAAEKAPILWSPEPAQAEGSQMMAFLRTAERRSGRQFDDYGALWAWSTDAPAAF